ncbi:hypothetical protein PRUPE_5G181700 [Prunus persica]|uniref:Uncharacterized protein n=1 Tax=Prunus persica TaxID=3760 RepID=A0A251PA85_PRUPE|nr:hypothetical protein PRUPE_5G181700 [Prunus persica]
MPYDIPTYSSGIFAVMKCKSTLERKELVLKQVKVAKLAIIEAIVNAVFSAVQTGTVPPELVARAASASLASEMAQEELDWVTEYEQELRVNVSQFEILPVVTAEDMQILLYLKRMQNWAGSVYIDRSSEENKGVILRMAAGAGINVYEGPLNLGPFGAP